MHWEKVPPWAKIITQLLLRSLRERDPYTYGHCLRVARNARLLAKAAGLSEEEQRIIEISGLFHDLGKIGIPDRILLKAGRLTPEEEAVIQEHPVKSVEILKPLVKVPFFKAMIPGIRHHHERMDGAGYPDRIQGKDIPLFARIILIADTYDAITTTRSYRTRRPPEFAYQEIKQFSGRQFDPHLTQIFLKAHPKWGDIEEEITEEFVRRHFHRAA